MLRISNKDRLQAHLCKPPKRYARGYQRNRILLSRKYVDMALSLISKSKPTLCEVGCGVLDICGPYAIEKAHVVGYELNPLSASKALEFYPHASMNVLDINNITNIDCDILVACEVLEHIENPAHVIKTASEKSKILIVSHPICEPSNSEATNGEHCWSFSYDDFSGWFYNNGFDIKMKEYFYNGDLHTAIGIGVKK